MEKMLVTKALNELNLLDDRIAKAVNSATFVAAAKTAESKVTPNKSKQDFITEAKSSYQSIMDLIERRAHIKSAIVASNAVTQVEINGETMTVADAIELKTSIEYEAGLLRVLKNQLSSANTIVTRENDKLENKIDNILETMVAKDAKTKKEDYSEVIEPMRKSGEYSLVDPLDIEKKIAALDAYISGFKSEVDSALQISNCTTWIEF